MMTSVSLDLSAKMQSDYDKKNRDKEKDKNSYN